MKKAKATFPPESPKQCPYGHKHISWSEDDDHVFCWECNRRYLLLACFKPPKREPSDPERPDE